MVTKKLKIYIYLESLYNKYFKKELIYYLIIMIYFIIYI